MSYQEILSEIQKTQMLIIERLDQLDRRLTQIEQSTKNMDEHIGFVEHIYGHIYNPVTQLLSWVGMTTALPEASRHQLLIEQSET